MTTLGHRLPNGTIPVLLSADSPDLVVAEARNLLAYVTGHPEHTPEDVAGMILRTRGPRRHRVVCMIADGADSAGLTDALGAVVAEREHPAVVRTAAPDVTGKVAFVFPGQGTQRPGMGRLFYDSVPAYRDEAQRCATAFADHVGASPLEYLLDVDAESDDSARIVQPALFTHMAALAATWQSYGVVAAGTVGHSQGEVAAAYVSGLTTLADAVRVVGIRAAAADEFMRGDYAMGVVAAPRDECEDLLARCNGWAQLSVVNSATMVGISGHRDTVASLVDAFTARDVFARVMPVRYPAHTTLINDIGDTVLAQLGERLERHGFPDTDAVCIGATLGGPITADLTADDYWFLNLRNTVRFDKAVAAARAQEFDVFVELADHPTLQLAIRENLVASDGAGMVLGTSVRAAEDLGEFTRNLVLAAIHSPTYPWHVLGTESDGPPPLPLLDFPNSVTRRWTSWLPYTTTGTAPAEIAVPVRRDEGSVGAPPRLLVERWLPLTKRSLVPPRTIGIVDHTGACADVAAALCTSASDIGASARVLDTPGGTEGLDTIVILVPAAPDLDAASAVSAVATFFADRAWWPVLADSVTACWLVTVGGEHAVPEDDRPDLLAAAASAGFRSIGAEHSGVRFAHLDLPGSGVSAEPLAIVTALHTDGETELALRGGAVLAKRAVEGSDVAAIALSPRHALLVGGSGKVGLELCAHLARSGARRITVVNRSGESSELTARLRTIRAATSVDIRVVACDVSDVAAVAQLASAHRDDPADLIVHAAVDYSGIEFSDITAASVDHALQSKVLGAQRILDAFPRTADCRAVLCSSIGANVGGRGLILYAAANRMIDAMATRLRSDGLDCVSIQWGHWAVTFDPAAESTERLGSTGLVPMSAGGAVKRGLGGLRENAIVAAFDLERARLVLALCGRDSLLSHLDSLPAGRTQHDGTELPERFLRLIASTIGLDRTDSIDTTVPLVAIELDSLQALEVRRRVKAEFDFELEVADLLGGASIGDVLARLSG